MKSARGVIAAFLLIPALCMVPRPAAAAAPGCKYRNGPARGVKRRPARRICFPGRPRHDTAGP